MFYPGIAFITIPLLARNLKVEEEEKFCFTQRRKGAKKNAIVQISDTTVNLSILFIFLFKS
ncbi:MAG: hypothetical protein EA343_15780 [Nodularia sp. (in: Bacteria)]|nr:MAG: hypothetical protein EA343_15780 [Nodularia sp. (in: cyanobacteria)]